MANNNRKRKLEKEKYNEDKWKKENEKKEKNNIIVVNRQYEKTII